MMQRSIVLLGFFLLTSVLPALADDALLQRGKALIEANCSKCHAVGATGESPFKDAPPFREVAPNYTMDELVDGFMEGLAVRHEAMPDWEMDMGQAEAIAAYILSLKSAGAPAEDTPEGLGFVLLRKNCAACHAIDRESASPFPKAPPFREVAKRYPPEQLEESLAEGIVTGHEGMPEASFTPEEISGIVAWLNALKEE
jgi:mono/diheme cytochrome c family protein